MPTKIREHNNKIIDRYYEQMSLKDSIEYARALIARLNNSDYQGLTSESASGDHVNIEKESKDDEGNKNIIQEKIDKAKLLGRPIEPYTQFRANRGGMGFNKAGASIGYKYGGKAKL